MTLADCTVLVVEDHEFQRRTTLQILANLGAGGLLEAVDGEDALALLLDAGPRPDIVVCDLDMPGMDGVEFLRHVARLGAGTAIVIASGLDESVLRSAEATARGYGLQVLGAIRKPLTARLLLQAVGLHRPQPAPAPAPAAGGGGGDPWAEALSDGRVIVHVHPRVELASGRLGAIEARAHRVDAPSVAASGLDARVGPRIDAAAEAGARGGATAAAGPDARMAAKVDAATDTCGPARGEVADAIAELVARAGLVAQRLLSDAGELIDVTLVLPPAALDGERVVERLAELADEAGVELGRICVALPDARGTSPGSSSKLASAPLALLTRLRVHGFGLGIDGFGSAGATLPQLERLPLTEVKIAAEALGRATASARGAEAFAATVQALRDQGLDVVCDGCDSHAEWQLALQAGCRSAQGTLVGPPLHPTDLSAWLRSWSGVA